jgi:hypothetical protein
LKIFGVNNLNYNTMATAKKKAAPAKGKWTPPWAKEATGKKATPKKAMGGKVKKAC